MSDEIIAQKQGRLGRITLNRPTALHALNRAMCAAMIDALVAWRDDAGVDAILIDHAPGTRGFCAGGDIRLLAESGAGDGQAARDFFFTEYRLNHLLKTYPKPTIALMDGVTMGGGVGISVHGPYRIATQRTNFAMPETGIGLFPDVGGGWFLPRLPGKVGAWLALTGARLKAADCLAAGVATHFAPSSELPELVRRLEVGDVAQTLAKVSKDAGAPAELAHRASIDRLFAHDTAEEIFAALESDGSEWAKAQLALLTTKSPQTMKVSLRQLREGANLSTFEENMRAEYRIACRVVRRHDFIEGVRALIVEKDNAPKWRPDTLAGVTDAMLDEIFAPLPAGEEWSPLPGV